MFLKLGSLLNPDEVARLCALSRELSFAVGREGVRACLMRQRPTG